MKVKVLVTQSCLTLCNSMDYSPPSSSPGKNGSYSFLQGVFQTQGSNQGLLHCRQILYCLSHKGRHLSRLPVISRGWWFPYLLSSSTHFIHVPQMLVCGQILVHLLLISWTRPWAHVSLPHPQLGKRAQQREAPQQVFAEKKRKKEWTSVVTIWAYITVLSLSHCWEFPGVNQCSD